MPGHEDDRVALLDARAVLAVHAHGDLRIEQTKCLEREWQAAHDAALTRDERRARPTIGHDRRDRRDVVERGVLLQR